jgi:hypothetical protein
MGWYANQKLANEESKRAKAAAKRGEAYILSSDLTPRRARAIESTVPTAWAAQERKDATQAETAVEQAARQAFKDLQSYCNGRTDQIAQCDGVHLFPDCLVLLRKGDPAKVDISGVSATVQTEGSLSVSNRATLARSLALTGWQKKTAVDTRATLLVIDGPEFEWVVDVPVSPPGRATRIPGVMDAHQFAAAVTTAARKSAGAA